MTGRPVTVLAASAVAIAACGGTASPTATAPAANGERIAAKVRDYAIRLDRQVAARGDVRFDIRNDGRIAHEFVILRRDHPAGKARISPGRTVTLTVGLTPGGYVLICDLAGHYRRGMHAAFRVA